MYHRVRLKSYNTEKGRRGTEFLAKSSDLFIYFSNFLFVIRFFECCSAHLQYKFMPQCKARTINIANLYVPHA